MKIKQRLVLLRKEKGIFIKSDSARYFALVDAKPFIDVVVTNAMLE
jgi:hypothetical protein